MMDEERDSQLPEIISEMLERSRRIRRWPSIPAALTERVKRLPSAPIAPASAETVWGTEWTPADVRGGVAGAETAGVSRVVTQIFPGGELALVAIPPKGDGRWRFQGTVWLREVTEDGIEVVLAHEEHVVVSLRAKSGENFDFDEYVGNGWTIEIHLPGGEMLEVREP